MFLTSTVALGEGSVDSLFHLVLLVLQKLVHVLYLGLVLLLVVLEKPVHCWLFSRIKKVHVFSQFVFVCILFVLVFIGGVNSSENSNSLPFPFHLGAIWNQFHSIWLNSQLLFIAGDLCPSAGVSQKGMIQLRKSSALAGARITFSIGRSKEVVFSRGG